MATAAPRLMTLAEFLDWDDGTDARYELIGGRPVAMAPPGPAHSVIVGNLARLLGARVKTHCYVAAEAGVVPNDRSDAYYQADLVVSCTPMASGAAVVPAPALIVEVLSPSTAQHDRGTKLVDYRELPSVREILLVSSQERRVELWRRDGERWIVETLIGEAELRLGVLDAGVPLAIIYENVAL